MLKITRETEYGLMAMIHIATRSSGSLGYRREIADAFQIPNDFLAKVLQKLSRSELIRSQLGVLGGYSLSRHASKISFGEIVEAIEGPQKVVECVDGSRDCVQLSVCPIERTMRQLQKRFRVQLQEISLAEMCRMAGPAENPTLPAMSAPSG